MKRQDAANFALEMLDRDGITDVINALSDKLLGGGTAGATVTVANFIYTGIDFIMKKMGVIDIQDYLKVQYAMLDQSWLKLAVSNQRLNIFNSVYDTKTLKIIIRMLLSYIFPVCFRYQAIWKIIRERINIVKTKRRC